MTSMLRRQELPAHALLETTHRFYVDQTSLPSFEPVEKQFGHAAHGRFCTSFVMLMTELNGSDITMWFSWLTDLVFCRTYASVRGVNRPTGGH